MTSRPQPDAVPKASFVQRFTGPALVSWPVLVVVTGWSAVLALLGGGAAVSGIPLVRAALGALSGAAAFGIVWILWWLAIRHLAGAWRILVAGLVVVMGGVVRGLVMQAGLTALDYADSSAATLATRVANGVATMPVAFVIAAAAVSALRSYRETASALVAEQARLLGMLEESTRVIEERQADAVERVRTRLDEELRAMPMDSTPAAVAALESFAGDVVRPLSHSLARDLPKWEIDTVREVPRVRWLDVWRAPDARVAIQPVWLPAACLVVAVPASFLILDPRYGVPAVLATIVELTLSLAVARWLLRRHPPVRPWLTWFCVVAALVLSAAIVAGTVLVIARDDPSAGVFVGPGVFAVIVFGLLIATASMMRARMQETTEGLQAVARDLRWTLARVNTRQWEQKGRLSRALHGPVQSLAQAHILRMRQRLDGGAGPVEGIDSLRADLHRALTDALGQDTGRRDLPQIFVGLARTWDGVASVGWEIVPMARGRLERDPLCALAISDLAVEAVSNAVRHGGARRVDLYIWIEEPDLAVLRVVDDGVRPEHSSPGLGTALLTQCAFDWSLTSASPTTLTVRLPCRRPPV